MKKKIKGVTHGADSSVKAFFWVTCVILMMYLNSALDVTRHILICQNPKWVPPKAQFQSDGANC